MSTTSYVEIRVINAWSRVFRAGSPKRIEGKKNNLYELCTPTGLWSANMLKDYCTPHVRLSCYRVAQDISLIKQQLQ